MWILVIVLFSVVVALLSYLDMRKPKNYPPGIFRHSIRSRKAQNNNNNNNTKMKFRSKMVAGLGQCSHNKLVTKTNRVLVPRHHLSG